MKARVHVTLKSTVLDPQGQTVRAALQGLGYRSITEVRQGKYFDVTIDASSDREQARKDVDAIAHDVLANPVIEEYRIEFLDD
jgi:phosphoribosylformylglycinamidine synthase subunit PurS